MEIAHIIPWARVKKHEFKNLIALCPTCHARFDDPHGAIDLAAMKQYKEQLNPLLSAGFGGSAEQIRLFAAYQEFRVAFSAWVRHEIHFAKVKARGKRSAAATVERLRQEGIEPSAKAICSALDFQSAWKDSEASDLAGAIFYHVAEWSGEVGDSSIPLPRELAARDIAEEIAEASARLHAAVCEQVGI